jgi:hypothetical protein
MSDYQPQKTFCPECRKDVDYQIKELVEKKRCAAWSLNIKQKELIVMNVSL